MNDSEDYKIEQYENYRQFFLGADTSRLPDGGISLLLRKGMQIWYLSSVQSVLSNPECYKGAGSTTNAGRGFESELTRILGNLTIGAMGGI